MNLAGEFHGRAYSARWAQSKATTRECEVCGGVVRRSWRTGLLHAACFACRYLRMIYGHNIKVRRLDS